MLRKGRMLAWIGAALVAAVAVPQAMATPGPRHGIAMHGEPALPRDFQHFPYVRPDAPRGGRLVMGMIGTFDSLNPFIVRGLAVPQIRGHVIESLMARSLDEPFSLYGLIAESIETDDARTWVVFRIDPRARFADGRPVTAEDVLFSWRLLRDRGRPNHRTYYRKVTAATAPDPLTVRFEFGGAGDREMPLILGLMPVLPRHAVDAERFEQTSLVPPLGSGPYVVEELRPGESLVLRRNPDYWGRDLPVNRGHWNFDEIRLDWYRDSNAHFEAFKKGLYDLRVESDPGRWMTGYDIPAVRDGRIVRDSFRTGIPRGMSGLVFNTRRPIFADIRVREALVRLFDFEWIDANLYFGAYVRTGSYFEASELSARGRPATGRERELLARFPGVVRDDVMEGRWQPPVSDGSGRDRETLRAALALLAQAGWTVEDGQLRDAAGRPFSFEVLVTSREQERLALAWSRQLRRAGIDARTRLVDAVQFDRRRQTFDYDMIQNFWGASLSPGNEQAFHWGSAAADQPGSRNYMGVREPAVDAMIEAMLSATTREDFVSAVRALDRVLISGHWVVPLFHLPDQWMARWSHIERPEKISLFGPVIDTWWRRP